ncbi:MAG: sigma-70 family RNA polymerase sigma factor [Phycisphaeraceae bacterium]
MSEATSQWERAIEEQASEHGRFYFRVAQGILRDAAAAEDACQQALLRAWQQEEAIRDVDRIRAWLTRVVVNESLQVLRKRKREREVLADQRVQDNHSGDPGAGLAVRETVRLALDELPEPTRTVVVLRLINGFTGNEVKAMLKCSASEVSRRLHAGMDQLRDHFVREGV